MYAEITAAIQSVKTLTELARSASALSNQNEIVLAIADVNTKLIEATAMALASQERHSELLNRVSTLEKEISDLLAKQAKAEKYTLHEFPTGALVYKLKEENAKSEPLHFLCPKCVSAESHSMLQPWGSTKLRCPACNLVVPKEVDPPAPPLRRSRGTLY